MSGVKRGANVEQIPAEVSEHIAQLCERMFVLMADSGNTKEITGQVIESVLDSLQTAFMENIEKFDLKTTNEVNVDFIMLTALVRVSLTNPMYGSDALTLQLRQAVRNIVHGADGWRLDDGGE